MLERADKLQHTQGILGKGRLVYATCSNLGTLYIKH